MEADRVARRRSSDHNQAGGNLVRKRCGVRHFNYYLRNSGVSREDGLQVDVYELPGRHVHSGCRSNFFRSIKSKASGRDFGRSGQGADERHQLSD